MARKRISRLPQVGNSLVWCGFTSEEATLIANAVFHGAYSYVTTYTEAEREELKKIGRELEEAAR